MQILFERAGLADVAEKIRSFQRVSPEQIARLFRCSDLNAVGLLADIVRRRLNGDNATFVRNRYINYSNICLLSCQFCAFARKKNEAGAFEHTVEEIADLARQASEEGATELHIVGGLHPTLKQDFYLSMLDALRQSAPALHLKMFTAIEIRHLADRVFKMPIAQTLALLREHGLGSLTGGGAEIFDPSVRDTLCRGKESADEWLEVHRLWHGMGGRSTCTMLYGHVETPEQRADHLDRLRRLQDETGGFTGFIPLPYQPEDNALTGIPRCSGFEDLRVIATSRLALDNIPHLTGYWVGLGPALAQVSLNYGADDLHGTIMDERIFHMAGAKSPAAMTEPQLRKLIAEAGRSPVQRDSHYCPITPAPENKIS